MAGICPHCAMPVTSVRIGEVTGNATGGKKWNCISYSCNACNKVLSVAIDPVALKTDTVNEIKGT